MNARLAITENENMTNILFESSKKLSQLKGISIEEAIDYKVSIYEKYAKNDNEAYAWYLRGENAKKMINK